MRIRTLVLVSLVSLGLAGPLLVGAPSAAEKPWFDMKNCDLCAPYMAEPGLMEHMHMQYFPISTGLFEITEVPAEYEAAYTRASGKCNDLMAKWQKGEKVNLCGYCTSLGTLSKTGAKVENLKTDAGFVLVATSTDPTLIQKLHSHVEKTNAEMMKMSQATASKASDY